MQKKTVQNTQKQSGDISDEVVIYDEIISEIESDTEESKKGVRALEPYNYINIEAIKKALNINAAMSRKGKKVIKDKDLELEEVSVGYFNSSQSSPACLFEFTGTEDTYGYMDDVNVNLILSRDKVLDVECDCSECYGMYFGIKNPHCKYVAAAFSIASDYLEKHSEIMDATDMRAMKIIQGFSGKKRSQIISESRQQKNSLRLTPRIIYKDGDINLSFKIGDGGKDFVIKDLVHFADLVFNSDTETYGSNKVINHGIQNFSDDSKKWVDFILDCIAEEKRIRSVIEEETWKKYNKKVANLEIYSWRIDKLYNFFDGRVINYENRETRNKMQLKCMENNPNLSMTIRPAMNKKSFDGIKVSMSLPDMYMGTESAYYIDENNALFCKTTNGFYEKMRTFISGPGYNTIKLNIGRTNLSEFYYNVLPEISDYVDVVEEKPEIIEQYLLPETKFSFYLDADNGDVTCKAVAEYGDKRFSCLDMYKSETKFESYRLESREREVLYVLEQMFSVMELEEDRVSCGSDEDRIYDVVSGGIEKLAELGNVYCTKRFRNVKTRKSTSLNVGVSVSGGMLQLELLTQDMTADELLELLKNYKRQSRYYRFKSGEFIEVEDSALQMLFEMMETMHMSPKEFVKGKMHIPIYRTLYLDKMLENHSEVYNTRDQQFKAIIKNMKSISEADYEVPMQLDRTMRNYQKYGFKWMKTLESCGFGGILADDMGLGKTLQTISVLLDAKENGLEGTSIIVSPASLVYNWAEEFEKFAPEIKVQVLGGSALERSEIISDYENADVLVTSYDILKRDIDQYDEKEFLYEIIDEAQYIKNPTTAAAKAVKVINSKARFALTGTPIENRLSELWSIFDYLMPGFLYSYDVFKKEYENPIVKYNDEEKMVRLQKMVKPFILRRLKKDVLKDLPEKLEETRVVRFAGEQRKLYDAQVVHMKNELTKSSEDDFKKNKLRILAELTKLRQICCDPNLCYDNYKGESAKLESCMELIESAISGGHKMLLFSQFTSMLAIIESALNKQNIKYYKITGETTKQDRLNMVKQFNEDETPIFLISIKAGGVGLNLTGADMVIHYDPWWNVAVQNQATDRAHRIGQTKKVTVYKMIAKGTIEEKIVKLQETKQNLADNIVNGENVGISGMSKEDLMELLGV